MLGSMVRRRDRILFCSRSSWARAKLSSLTSAGTGISIHSSRGRSWPAVVPGVTTPRRRSGRMTRVRAEARVSSPTPHYPLKFEITFCVRGVISPLLSNLYMRRFVLGWKKLGHEKRLAAHIVNYADDLVICCRGRAEEALATMRDIMTKLKLTVNETKTRVCKLPEEKFDFLGYTFGRCYSQKTGRAYLGTVPSKKRVIRICEALSEMTGRDQTQLDQGMVVARLNRTMIGWANYFCLGPVSKAYRAVESHARKRLLQWLCAKHKLVFPAAQRFPEASLHEVLGLVCLTKRTSNLPWATS